MATITNLPNELILAIASNIEGYKDFSALMRTNRRMLGLLCSELYKDFPLDLHFCETLPSFQQKARSLDVIYRHALDIREIAATFKVHLDYQCRSNLGCGKTPEIGDSIGYTMSEVITNCKNLVVLTVDGIFSSRIDLAAKIIRSAITQLPNLTDININFEERGPFKFLEPELAQPIPRAQVLARLRKLSIFLRTLQYSNGGDTNEPLDPFEDLRKMLSEAITGLDTLELGLHVQLSPFAWSMGTYNQRPLEATAAHWNTPKLRTLIFDHNLLHLNIQVLSEESRTNIKNLHFRLGVWDRNQLGHRRIIEELRLLPTVERIYIYDYRKVVQGRDTNRNLTMGVWTTYCHSWVQSCPTIRRISFCHDGSRYPDTKVFAFVDADMLRSCWGGYKNGTEASWTADPFVYQDDLNPSMHDFEYSDSEDDQ